MGDRTYYQPGDVPERRTHPEFGVSEDRAQLLISKAINASMREHEKVIMQELDSRFGELSDMIKSAFPEGDPHGHRRAHEQEIREAAGWSKLKADLISRVMTGGVWAGLVWLAYISFEALKQEFKK